MVRSYCAFNLFSALQLLYCATVVAISFTAPAVQVLSGRRDRGRSSESVRERATESARLAERADALDEEIERLTRMRDSLRHAAVCNHSPLVACPHFKARIEGGAAPSANVRARTDVMRALSA
jgi:hypothetical protein